MRFLNATDVTDLSTIVLPGRTLTVWLNNGSNTIPIELRVTKGGKQEIFCDHLIVKKFDEWYKEDIR